MQKTAFPWQKLVAHINDGLPLLSADRYDVTTYNDEAIQISFVAVNKI